MAAQPLLLTPAIPSNWPVARPIAVTTHTVRLSYSLEHGTTQQDAASVLKLPYTLPTGTRDGGQTWYLIRLVARVGIDPGANPRSVGDVAAASDARTGIAAVLQPVVRGGQRAVELELLDLIDGVQNTVHTGSTLSIIEENYGQISAFAPGNNELEVALGPGRVTPSVIRWVDLLPGTGIYLTRVAPAQIRVRAPQRVRASVGATVTLPVTVVDQGDAGRDVTVRMTVAHADIRVVGSARRFLGTVTSSAARAVRFRVHVDSRGTGTIGFAATGSNVRASTSTAFAAVVGSSDPPPLATVIVVVVILGFAGGAGWWLVRRRG